MISGIVLLTIFPNLGQVKSQQSLPFLVAVNNLPNAHKGELFSVTDDGAVSGQYVAADGWTEFNYKKSLGFTSGKTVAADREEVEFARKAKLKAIETKLNEILGFTPDGKSYQFGNRFAYGGFCFKAANNAAFAGIYYCDEENPDVGMGVAGVDINACYRPFIWTQAKGPVDVYDKLARFKIKRPKETYGVSIEISPNGKVIAVMDFKTLYVIPISFLL